jgi:hypothetical protein
MKEVWVDKLKGSTFYKELKEMEIKEAEKRLCVCEDKINIIYLDTLDIRPHELETLNQFYCSVCNSFWREP